MSDESRTDLLARYVLCLFERVEQLERQVQQFRVRELIVNKIAATPLEAETPRGRRDRPHASRPTPLSQRDPAIAERWRKLVV